MNSKRILFSFFLIWLFLIATFNLTYQKRALGIREDLNKGENTAISIGDDYYFKFETLRLKGSSKDANVSILSNDYTEILIFKEDQVVRFEITNITVYIVEITNITAYVVNTYIEAWCYNENDSLNQNRIKVRLIVGVDFFMTNNNTYYEQKSELYASSPLFSNIEQKFESNRFYTKVKADVEHPVFSHTILTEEEIIIPRGIVSSFEIKITNYGTDRDLSFILTSFSSPSFSLHSDHIRFVSIDYPPIFAVKNTNEGIFNTLEDLFTDPFFYLILAEIGILVLVFQYIRVRKTRK